MQSPKHIHFTKKSLFSQPLHLVPEVLFFLYFFSGLIYNIDMSDLKIYRKRIIPSECVLLDGDEIVEQNEEHIITKWKTIHPRNDFDHGTSCYFLNDGVKVSKFYRSDDELLYWYCDIVQFDFSEDRSELTVTDLLADVMIYPNGKMKVVDLDELADAHEQNLITEAQVNNCLRQLDALLTLIYRDKFDKYQSCLDFRGL